MAVDEKARRRNGGPKTGTRGPTRFDDRVRGVVPIGALFYGLRVDGRPVQPVVGG